MANRRIEMFEYPYVIQHMRQGLSDRAIAKAGYLGRAKCAFIRSILYFRPAGAYGDASRSLHVDRVWVDEGAWLTERAWKALRQCLKAGGRLRIYSTPNGLRDTTYYRLAGSTQFRVFRWPSWLHPSWTQEREAELLEFYGGRDSAGWQHEVAGEHGKPSYGAFNIEHLNLCRQDVVEYQKVVVTGEELCGCATEEESHDRLEMLLNLMPRTGVFRLGGDLGYTNAPTEIVVFQEIELPERRIVNPVLRVYMEHLAYPHIAQTIALLDRYYTAAGVGVDNGGNGMAVVQELLTLDKDKDLALQGRLRGYDFGGMNTLAVRDGHEVRKRTKEFMTSLIAGALQRRQLVLPIVDNPRGGLSPPHDANVAPLSAPLCNASGRHKGKKPRGPRWKHDPTRHPTARHPDRALSRRRFQRTV